MAPARRNRSASMIAHHSLAEPQNVEQGISNAGVFKLRQPQTPRSPLLVPRLSAKKNQHLVNHTLLVLHGQIVKHRQSHQPFAQRFRHRQFAADSSHTSPLR